MHVARSERGVAACASWQVVQVACLATACSPGSVLTWWQLAHGGGGVAPGPCGWWQVAHGRREPWPNFILSAWQVAHAGVSRGVCGWWQLPHVAWPFGAVAACSAWQLEHAATGRSGSCGAFA